MGNVYVMINKENKNIKIGKSSNVENRLKSLNGAYKMLGEHSRIELIYSIECDEDGKLEKHLHKYFKRYNVQNEWFKLNPKIVIDYISNLDINDFKKEKTINVWNIFNSDSRYNMTDIKYTVKDNMCYVTPAYISDKSLKYFNTSEYGENIKKLVRYLYSENSDVRNEYLPIIDDNLNEVYLPLKFCIAYFEIYTNKNMIKDSYLDKLYEKMYYEFNSRLDKNNIFLELANTISNCLGSNNTKKSRERVYYILLFLLGNYTTYEEVPKDILESESTKELVYDICKNINLSVVGKLENIS